MQDNNMTDFVRDAIILQTANHLGIEAEMLDEARSVWKTKRLPDSSLLGHYSEAANKAKEEINKRGLNKESNRLGQVFYMTGEFPEPCEIEKYRDYLLMFTLRFALGDCTAGGLTSNWNEFEVFSPHLSFSQVANYCLEQEIDIHKALKLVYRKNLDYIHAEPIINRRKWYMAGGNFIYTSDSRFKELTGIRYPVSVHDRMEK